MTKDRVAIVISHPIQHFCPQYASWAKLSQIEIKVFFASKHGLIPYIDNGFNCIVRWDGIKLDFPYEFLPEAEENTLMPAIDSPDLVSHLSAFSPNVLIVYGYSQPLQRRALRWAKTNGISTLMISDSELRSSRSWMKRIIKLVWLPHVFRDVSLFLTVGDANEAYYRNYGVADDRLVRCFFPIDIHHYDTVMVRRDECRSHIRNQLGIPIHHKVVLMVGKLVSWKRQTDLIRFSNAIQSENNNITVVLAGTGPDETLLRSLVKRTGVGGVLFAGFVPPELLAEYYCAADVYAHCSEHEPHSLAISEAIYCGLPIVLSDRCGSYGPTDDVQPGLNGFVYRCTDIADLSAKLLNLINNDIARSRMGNASRTIARYHQGLAHMGALEQALNLTKNSGK